MIWDGLWMLWLRKTLSVRTSEQVSPTDFTPQQLVRATRLVLSLLAKHLPQPAQVFYAFFRGWRQKHGLPDAFQLSSKHQEMVPCL